MVLVPADRCDDATEVLTSRDGGFPPLPTSRRSLVERIFNVETALSVVFGVGAVILVAFLVVTAFVAATSLGAALLIALVVAGLAYIHCGYHGTVRKPERLFKRSGPVTGPNRTRCTTGRG